MMTKTIPSKSNPHFGIITPVDYLEKYATQSSFHLVLAHLVDTNDEYANFYAKMSERGDFVICDNGAYELGESYAPEKLIELAQKCKADVVVLPDYPFQIGLKTIEASLAVIKEIKAAGFKTMFVPQSKTGDVGDFMNTYSWAAHNDDIDVIGMSILGIPNAINWCNIAFARVLMTKMLMETGNFNFHKYHHYLGLNGAPNVELPTLIKMGALDSCDSSNPVWCGINGHRYNASYTDWAGLTKPHLRHVNFSEPMHGQFIQDIIQHNIDMTKSCFDSSKQQHWTY